MSQLKDPRELFKRFYNLEREVLDAKELQKELKEEFTASEYNSGGLESKYVGKIIKAAKAQAKQDDLKTKVKDPQELDQIISELGV